MAKSKASSLSSAEVRRQWEEPAEETGLTSGSVGILAIYGGEDVKILVYGTKKYRVSGFPNQHLPRKNRSAIASVGQETAVKIEF